MNLSSHTSTRMVACGLAALSLVLGACVADEPSTGATEHALTGSPILLPWSGTGQDREVTSSFDPLVIKLHDTFGQPIANATVTFSAPANGASAWFKFQGIVQTDDTGFATIQAYANSIAGTYLVHATVDGADPIPFALTNTAAAPAVATPVGGTNQAYLTGLPFPYPLEVAVFDNYGNAVEDAPVQFVAPTGEATTSMTADGHATTDARGRARVFATAGNVAGTYTVTALIAGAPPVPFVLTNLASMTPPDTVTATELAATTTGTRAP